jgi:hypothetical protein
MRCDLFLSQIFSVGEPKSFNEAILSALPIAAAEVVPTIARGAAAAFAAAAIGLVYRPGEELYDTPRERGDEPYVARAGRATAKGGWSYAVTGPIGG